MKRYLIIMLLVGSAAHAQTCTAPGPAAAAGYTTETLGGSTTTNFSPFSYFGASGVSSTPNADGSLTVNGGGDTYGAQMQSNGAFGGGGYFQATMNGTGDQSFWANDIQSMTASSTGQTPPDNSWIEADMAEFDAPGVYGGALHNWYGTSSGNQAVSTYNSGSPFNTALSGTHTYGFLWVPATATSQGYVQWFLDGQQVGNTITWNQYQAGQTAQQNPYAVLDTRQLQLILGTGDGNATTFSNVQVWQASTADDTGLSGSSVSGPCPAVAATPAVATTAKVTPVQTAAAAPSTPSNNDVQDPTPGDGSATDCSGNVWAVTTSGAITENGEEVSGGHGTSDLVISGCTVYGLDSSGRGWFTISSVDAGDPQYWLPSAAPSAASTVPVASPASDTSGTPAVSTSITAPVLPVGTCAPSEAVASGAFHVAGGQIIGPNGVFIARGINVYSSADPVDEVGAALSVFPGLNFVRYIVRSLDDPSSYQAFVSQFTTRGIVVEFENHPNGGGGQNLSPPQGLATESAWYAAMATLYAGNPYVWFGTFNEPGTNMSGDLSAWQQATYNAVRSGSNTILLVEDSGVLPALVPSVYAGMHNIVWDQHIYANSDPNSINAIIAADQGITSADGIVPVIIGESGPSMDGTNLDSNGYATVESLINIAQGGSMGGLAQFTLWPGFGSPNDITDSNGTPTQPYGQMVQMYAGTSVIAPTQCQLNANGATAANTANAKAFSSAQTQATATGIAAQ